MSISEERRAYNKKYYQENAERFKAYREDVRKNKREQINARRRELYQQDEQRRIANRKNVREYNKKNPLAKRASTYGIDRGDLELMLDRGCAICGANALVDSRVKLHIDHNHHTGKVRGVLCSSCNLALGHFHDDPILLGTAINYVLKEYRHHE